MNAITRKPLFSNTLPTLALLLGTVLSLLSGCFQQQSAEEAPPDPATLPIKFAVYQLEQYSSLDNKNADGQYLVVKLSIKNEDKKAVEIKPEDLLLTNVTEKPEDKYTQSTEKYMGNAFSAVYGPENSDKLLESAPALVQPQLQVERFLIYQIPKESSPEKYHLLYQPYKLEIPLVTEVTVVNDHRNAETTEE